MKERPILYSTPMVIALLLRLKTQTRRTKDLDTLVLDKESGYAFFKGKHQMDIHNWKEEILQYCPYGQPGDILWVRETFGRNELDTKFPYRYKATDGEDLFCKGVIKWKPSIHMPKEAARIFLHVKSVRVEKANDISIKDSIAEGIIPLAMSSMQLATQGQLYFDYTKKPELLNEGLSAKKSFESLWQSINGVESWKANPWVWVVGFEVLSTTGKPDTSWYNKAEMEFKQQFMADARKRNEKLFGL